MRPDFSKLLTERERIHHADHFHNYRHVKGPKGAWGDDEVGGREGMRVRYNHGYDRKSFSENLNPLKSWVHSCLGKKWDKMYGELRKQFDARKIINKHILKHLFSYIEVNTFLHEGAVCFTDTNRYSGQGVQPISKCYKDYYVCPKSGMVRKTNKQPKRSIVMQQAAEKKRKVEAVKRVLSDTEVLHLIDGVWYHFDLLPIPTAHLVYEKPLGTDIFKTCYQFLGTPNSRREKTWDELNQSEKERFGKARVIGGTARDEFTNQVVYRDQRGTIHLGHSWMNQRRDRVSAGTYHANKKTASKKHLKLAGLHD